MTMHRQECLCHRTCEIFVRRRGRLRSMQISGISSFFNRLRIVGMRFSSKAHLVQ
jgi:hypothetical protein